MRIHHLNCACMCPVGGALFDGFSKGLTAKLGCHCLLLETESGLVLVDTGIGMRDIENKTSRISPFFIGFNNIKFKPEHTAWYQIKQLGFSPDDVRHIVLTHLDFDHAGGIEDFPNATVHVLKQEKDATQDRTGFIRKRRYQPAQWDQVKQWELYEEEGEEWYGFKSVRDLKGLPPEILFVPLSGHTPGHAGIAVNTENGWVLNAGDAYFYRHEMDKDEYRCTPGLRYYQWMMEVDRDQRLYNQERLRELKISSDVRMFCSHDVIEFKRFSQPA